MISEYWGSAQSVEFEAIGSQERPPPPLGVPSLICVPSFLYHQVFLTKVALSRAIFNVVSKHEN